MLLRSSSKLLAVSGAASTVLALSVSVASAADDQTSSLLDEKSVEERLHRFQLKTIETLGLDAVTRASRALYHGLLTAIDYKVSCIGQEVDSEEYKATLSKVHRRSAERLLYVCQQHSGAYSKFGQYLSTLVKIIPDEYTLVLKALQDAQPGVPLKDVRRVIQEDFGMPLTSLYASFDPKPIAAASLAQVHRAVTIDGQTVAVKVQYPRLAQQTKMDMTTLQFLAVAVGVLFKDYEYGWLFPEFAESMQLELDFLQEATNAERIEKIFAKNKRIYIPTIRWDLSTKRVLSMEFIDGVKVNNVQALKEKGINPVAVGETVSGLFSLMIFSAGFVHTDPHAGNILIRRPPGSSSILHRIQRWVGLRPSFEVVLLDHGMYRRLNESFRLSYCNLWKAFMTRDEELGKKATAELGLDPAYFELLSLISVNRTPKSKVSLGESMSVEEKKALREKFEKYRDDRERNRAQELKRLIEGLPRDILFVLRSNSLVRSLNSELGAGIGNRFRIFGGTAVVGLSMPTVDPLPPAYFLEEIRDYVQVLPAAAGGGRVLQKRRKAEMIRRPDAPVNKSTASEAFLFSPEPRPIYKEIKRQIAVADLRARVWLIDQSIEWFQFIRGWVTHLRDHKNWKWNVENVRGELIAEKQLHLQPSDVGTPPPPK